MADEMLSLSDFKSGQRVQLHPATDAWMRGMRFAEVLEVRLTGRTFHGPKRIKLIADVGKFILYANPCDILEII